MLKHFGAVSESVVEILCKFFGARSSEEYQLHGSRCVNTVDQDFPVSEDEDEQRAHVEQQEQRHSPKPKPENSVISDLRLVHTHSATVQTSWSTLFGQLWRLRQRPLTTFDVAHVGIRSVQMPKIHGITIPARVIHGR